MSKVAERLPLHSIEAEMSVLGSMILSTSAATGIIGRLEERDFYRPAHRLIFRAMGELIKHGREIDLVTLRAELVEKACLPDVGGIDFLIELAEYVPSAANAEDYAEIVIDRRRLRDLEELGGKIVALVHDSEGGTATEKFDKAGDMFIGAQDGLHEEEFKPISGPLRSIIDRIDKAMESGRPELGVSSGFPKLDEMTCGYVAGNFVLVGARTSMGKTSYALGSAIRVARQGIPVLYVTIEMTAEEVTRRAIAAVGGIPLRWTQGIPLNETDYQRVTDAMERLTCLPIDFVEASGSFGVASLRSNLHRATKKHGRPPIVFIDYLQIMQTSSSEYRALELTRLARDVKAMSKSFKTTIVGLSQINQAVDKRDNKRPMLGDYSDSSGLSNEADVALALYRDEYYKSREENRAEEPNSVAEILILKNRNGPLGTVEVAWEGAYTRFAEVAA